MNVSFLRDIFSANLPLKIVAFTLTLSLFIWVRDDRQASVVAYAPVRIVIPEGMVLKGTPIDRVRLTVRGRWSIIERFDPTSVRPVQLVPSTSNDLQLLTITEDMIQLESGLQVTAVQPDVVQIELEAKQSKLVRIQPRLVGEPPEGFVIGEPTVTPAKIAFSGPKSNMELLSVIQTEPVDLSARIETFEQTVSLVTDDPSLSYDIQQMIKIRVPIKTLEVPRVIQEIPVVVLNANSPVVLRPPTISATVRGPKSVVDAMKAERLQVTIDLDGVPKGTVTRQPTIKNLPPNVTLADYHPKDILVTVQGTDGQE